MTHDKVEAILFEVPIEYDQYIHTIDQILKTPRSEKVVELLWLSYKLIVMLCLGKV